jgi:hypothetical protein
VTEEDRAVARTALVAYFHKVYPDRTPPGLLDEATVEQAARCAATQQGSREKKLQALQDSIDGAFEASSRATTTAFIWGRPEHFVARWSYRQQSGSR